MADVKKTIQINPLLFKIGGHNKTKREKKQKPQLKGAIRPNTLKKSLLQRIKDHQKNERENMKERMQEETNTNTAEVSTETPDVFTTDFKSSISYLEQLSKDRKKAKKLKRQKKREEFHNSLKNPSRDKLKTADVVSHNIPTQVNVSLPMSLKNKTYKNYTPSTEPPYGILKGGGKPLYSDWKRQTLKKTTTPIHTTPIHIENPPTRNNPLFEHRQKKLTDLKAKFQTKFKNDNNLGKNLRTQEVMKKTIKHKYKLGRLQDKVVVLIKNNETRKNIQRECDILKRKKEDDIKAYLRRRGLIKTGSDPPIDVLRKIYESAYLTGDVYNKNKETLIHNYFGDAQGLHESAAI